MILGVRRISFICTCYQTTGVLCLPVFRRRFYAPLARTKNASASAGSVRRPALLARRAVARAGTAAAAAAGSYSLVRSHSNRSGSVGAEEGSDVEMIGYV